ncbi:MAG TPA: hypothetical protein VMZ26_11475 [Pyrinomonadaceae bacterium]|nr:hypothetical protein [Pyrinomonadaceae bacterium]
MTSRFPEDTLPLLGPSVYDLEPQEFHERISSFYAERSRASRVAKKKPPRIKGKVRKRATKKRYGEYSVEYSGKEIFFAFPETRIVSSEIISNLTEALTVDRRRLKEFLKTKNFSFDVNEPSE